MADWTLLHMRSPLNTVAGNGAYGELSRASSRKFTFSAATGDADTLTFTMPARHQQAAAIEPLVSDVLVFRGEDQMPVQRFRVVTRSLAKDSVLSATFTAVSYRALLDAWVFHDGDTRSFPTATEQTDIAWKIIDEGQTRSNGWLGIVRGALPQTPVMRTLIGSADEGGTRPEYFQAGMKRSEAIDNLANMLNGFEWTIRPDPADPYRQLVFDTWNLGGRNQHGDQPFGRSSLLLDDDGSMMSWSHTVTPTDYGNVVRYTGGEPTSSNDSTAAVALTAVWQPAAEDPALPAPEGRWERDVNNGDLTTQAAVASYAPGAYDEAHIYVPEITCTLARERWQGPSQLWLGDQARLLITESAVDDDGATAFAPTGETLYLLYVDEDVRIVEVDVDVDEQGAEDVSLSLNRRKFSTVKNTRTINDRLNRLERR